MIQCVCSDLRDSDVARGLLRKGNGRYPQLSRTGGDRGSPVGAVIGYRYGILVG